jgi:hypothetical protein
MGPKSLLKASISDWDATELAAEFDKWSDFEPEVYINHTYQQLKEGAKGGMPGRPRTKTAAYATCP